MNGIYFLMVLSVMAAVGGCAEGPRKVPEQHCELFADGGCPPSRGCRLVAGGESRCVTPQAPLDEGCTPESCEPNEACVSVEGLLKCRQLCQLDGRILCPDQGQCTYPVEGAPTLGVCSRPCTLEGDCGLSGTCAPSGAIPYPVCVAEGPASLGQDCTEARCSEGLACLTVDGPPRCFTLCTIGSDDACDEMGCTGTIAQVTTLGYCPSQETDSP